MKTSITMPSIFATSSYVGHSRDQMQQLAAWGFTHVVSAMEGHGRTAEVSLGHEYGLKMLARWPQWGMLGCLGEDMAFRNALGESNAGGTSLVLGPSVWNTESERHALESLPAVAAEGWDGVLIHILVGDRPMPTAWHQSRHHDWKNLYWSFDEEAKQQYGTLRRPEPMPSKPVPLHDLDFYRWYQSGWLHRLDTFTSAALEHFKEVATWFIPMDWHEPETWADGTADSVPAISKWRQGVLNAGADPLVVVGHMFGMGSAWEPKARKTMQEQNAAGWRSIVGAECNPGVAARNLRENGVQARALGFTGLLCGDAALFEEADAVAPFGEWW